MIDEQAQKEIATSLEQNKFDEAYSLIESKINNPSHDKCIVGLVLIAYDFKELTWIQNIINYQRFTFSNKYKSIKYLIEKFLPNDKGFLIQYIYQSDAEITIQLQAANTDRMIVVHDNKAFLCSIIRTEGIDIIQRHDLQANEFDAKSLTNAAYNHLDEGFLNSVCASFWEYAINCKDIALNTYLISKAPRVTESVFQAIKNLDNSSPVLNKELMDYIARANHIEAFKCLLLKPTLPDEATRASASASILGLLNYKPGKKALTTYEYCTVANFNLENLKMRLEDHNETSDDDSSDDEYFDLKESIAKTLQNTVINEADVKKLKDRDGVYIEKYNKYHKKTSDSSTEIKKSSKIMRGLYSTNMHMILFRGIHRGPRCMVELAKADSDLEIQNILSSLVKKNNKFVYLITFTDNKWLICYLSQNKLYKYDSSRILPAELQNLLEVNYNNLTQNQLASLKKDIRLYLNKRQKEELTCNGHSKCTFSPELQQSISKEKGDFLDLEKIDGLVDSDASRQILQSLTKFIELEEDHIDKRLPNRYFQFFDAYVKRYGELFNKNEIQQYGFEGNPLISTSHRFERSFYYASGMRNNNYQFRTFPHYRRSTLSPKHRFLGVVRIFVFSKEFIDNSSESIAELIANKQVNPGFRKCFEAEIVIKSYIPNCFFIADIPIYLPNIDKSMAEKIDFNDLFKTSTPTVVFKAINKIIDRIIPNKIEIIVEQAVKQFIWSKDQSKIFYSPLSGGYIDKKLHHPTKARIRYEYPQDQLTMSESSLSETAVQPNFIFNDEAAKICKNYLIKPFPNGKSRTIHGVLHSCRVSIWALVLHNFLIKYQPGYDGSIRPSDTELLRIVCLFHDSGREGEGKDQWETQSSELFFNYIKKFQAYFSIDAIDCAKKSIINKNLNEENDYFVTLLHDADCLDYMRCVRRSSPEFELDRLFLYREFKDQQPALEELESIIYEISNIIHRHGDILNSFVINFQSRPAQNVSSNQQPSIKATYDHEGCYEKLFNECLNKFKQLQNPQLPLLNNNAPKRKLADLQDDESNDLASNEYNSDIPNGFSM